MIKQLFKSFLDEYRWYGIREGSSIVSYCEQCQCQRTHTCIEKKWVDGDWLFSFRCDCCNEKYKEEKR